MTKAATFRRASETFNEGVARSYPSYNELGDRAFAALLAENNTYPAGREAAIWWRCKDAGMEDEE